MAERKDSTTRVSSKLMAPAMSSPLPRDRLFRDIDELLAERGAVWIAAPAGSGKTTLAVSYLRHRGTSSLWYHLDSRDADPATWFHYLSSAPLVASPDAAKSALPVPRPDQQASLSSFALGFFDDFFVLLPEQTILVFDNVQDVGEDSVLHDCMLALIEAMPRDVAALFLSRHRPHGKYVRLLANQKLGALDPQKLWFNESEARALLTLRGHAPEFVEAHRQWIDTNAGWAAGLVLFSEWSRTVGHDEERLEPLNREAVAEYFASEIGRNLPAGALDCLAQCAILPAIRSDTAAVLTGDGTTLAVLEQLSRRNSFTTQHQGESLYYQFHPLFRDFLRHAFDRLSPETRERTTTTAARLLAEDGDVESALELLIPMAAWDAAALLILPAAPRFVSQGRTAPLLRWLQALPESVRSERPWLNFWLGIALTFGNLGAAREALVAAFDRFRAIRDAEGVYRTLSAIFRTILFEWSRTELLATWTGRLKEAMVEFPEFPNRTVEADLGVGLMAMMHWDMATDPDIYTWCRRTIEAGTSQPDGDLRAAALARGVFFWTTNGRIEDARALYPQLEAAVGQEIQNVFSRHIVVYTHYLYQYFFGDLDTALHGYRQLLDTDRALDLRSWTPVNLAWRGYAEVCAGKLDEARSCIADLKAIVDKHGPFIAHFLHDLEALVAQRSGDYPRAVRHSELAYAAACSSGGPYMETWALVGLALSRAMAGIPVGDALTLARRCARSINSELLGAMIVMAEAATAVLADPTSPETDARIEAALSTFGEQGVKRTHWPTASIVVAQAALSRNLSPAWARLLLEENTGGALGNAAARDESWPWKLRVYLFGEFRLYREGTQVNFGRKLPKRPIELLSALILHGGTVTQIRLLDDLWPDEDADAAHSALSSALNRLRKLVGADLVRLVDGRLTLDRERCWADTWACDVLARTMRTEDSPSTHDLDSYLALNRTALLESDTGKTWLEQHARHYRDMRTRVVIMRAAREEPAAAISRLEDAVRLDPGAESLHQALIAHYLAAGRRQDAVNALDVCRRRLRTLAGRDPVPETLALLTS